MLLTGMLASTLITTAAPPDYFVYTGTYTQKNSKGIYVYGFNSSTGALTAMGLAAEVANPSFLAVHPNRRFLFAVSEMDSGQNKVGSVGAFSIDPKTGKLTFLNHVASHGSGPCHVSVDHTGKTVLVANYDSGSVAAMPIGDNGHLGEASAVVQHKGSSVNPERQAGPHAHCIGVSPDNHFVLAADLGLDQVLVYRFNPVRGLLDPNNPPFGKAPAGSGPRHFVFHTSGRYVYVINEMQCTISTFVYDAAHGSLRLKDTIPTVPKGYKVTDQDSTAEVRIHPSGKFVYGSNRGHDSIAVFAVDPEEGTLTPIEIVSTQGKTPRGFNIDPSGKYLIAANQDSDSLVVFKIDARTGRLTATGQKLTSYMPVDVEFAALQ